jgi:hypothetical protein
MNKLIIAAIVIIGIFYVALNSSILAEQAQKWVKENPKDPHAPLVLYDVARWCDILGDNKKAMEVYGQIYQDYPDKSDLAAASLYYSAQVLVDTTSARHQADPYIDIILSQYPNEQEWVIKAKNLRDEVNYAR